MIPSGFVKLFAPYCRRRAAEEEAHCSLRVKVVTLFWRIVLQNFCLGFCLRKVFPRTLKKPISRSAAFAHRL